MGLARHEGEFEAAGEASLELRELLDALCPPVAAQPGSRSQAIANCLSGAEGWREAANRLGGAFAALGEATWLTDGKD